MQQRRNSQSLNKVLDTSWYEMGGYLFSLLYSFCNDSFELSESEDEESDS